MKKAFDNNLPRMKPRLRLQGDANDSAPQAAPPEVVAEQAPTQLPLDARPVERQPQSSAPAEVRPAERPAQSSAPVDVRPADRPPHARPSVDVKAAVEAALRSQSEDPRSGPTGFEPTTRPDERSAQRRRLRQRLAALGREPRPLDPDSPRAAEALLSAAEGIAGELADARARGDRLETELLRARADLDRALAEVTLHRRKEEDSTRRLEESQALLGTLETELSMLEEERDEVLFEVRALRGRDSDRQDSLQALSAELDRVRKELADAHAERAELLHELEAEEERGASLGRELARLETERIRWAEQVSAASGTQGALADSRRTIEEVHRVLALARTRPPRS
jgi:hypothetical protein